MGGGFATGLHTTLEPAVYGIPILIGPGFHGFLEAEDLVRAGGIQVVHNATDFAAAMKGLSESPEMRSEMGDINAGYILEQQGASDAIVSGVRSLLG